MSTPSVRSPHLPASRPIGRAGRMVRALLVLLQLVLPPAATVADRAFHATSIAPATETVVHGVGLAAAATLADCRLCDFLHAPATPAEAGSTASEPVIVHRAARVSPAPLLPFVLGSPAARAPPAIG